MGVSTYFLQPTFKEISKMTAIWDLVFNDENPQVSHIPHFGSLQIVL